MLSRDGLPGERSLNVAYRKLSICRDILDTLKRVAHDGGEGVAVFVAVSRTAEGCRGELTG